MVTEDTYGDGGEDDVRGRREDGVGEVAELSASSPASSRASSGARVLTEVERWKKDFFTAGDTYL